MCQSSYELIDFGNGRKLESVAGHLLDRPCPAAAGMRVSNPERWSDVDARFHGDGKGWVHHTSWPQGLQVDCGEFKMPVAPTPYGHIGLFPEQQGNWRWLSSKPNHLPAKSLNLFAYTGASTMALAKAGYQVAHVDAAKPNVVAARTAAGINGLAEHPIRYLIDDAAKFVGREVRRGNRYHTIVLDPPAYGHSPKGKAWRIERDIWPLLDDCLRLLDQGQRAPSSDETAAPGSRILVTGHSPQVSERDVEAYFQERLRKLGHGSRIEAGRSQLKGQNHRQLDAGFYVRVTLGNRPE